jgi:release factor glutamine methyltransferase
MNESELLFSHILKCDRSGLYEQRNRGLSKEESAFALAVLKSRMERKPIQYILGIADFFGFSFAVDPSVLIPRPETEILVEKAIDLIPGLKNHNPEVKILDLGTGSGCIAVALAKYVENARITAVDISKEALNIARENALKHDVPVDFRESDLFSVFSQENKFDLIVSNPPYVSRKEICALEPEISYEPLVALDGGEDGLDFYHRIAEEAGRHLNDAGVLLLEIGWDQAERAASIFRSYPDYGPIEVIKDYNSCDRILKINKPEKKG